MNERLDELIALAALGELDDLERAELDALVAADPDAATDLATALDTAAALQVADPVAPPPTLKASVLASIADTPQVPAPAAAPLVPPPVPLANRRRRRFAPVLAAAAAVVLIAVGGVFIATRGDSGTDDPVAAVLDADDVTTRTLTGQLGGTLEMAYSGSEGAMVLVGDDVPAVGTDETYQLWLVDDSGPPTSAGTFRPDDDGHVAVRVDGNPTDYVVGITLEPAGGSEQPTLPMLASA